MTHHDIEDMDAISSIPIGRLPVPPVPPRTDHDSQTVLDRAVTALGDLRFPLSRHDAAAQLHTLASLQADVRRPHPRPHRRRPGPGLQLGRHRHQHRHQPPGRPAPERPRPHQEDAANLMMPATPSPVTPHVPHVPQRHKAALPALLFLYLEITEGPMQFEPATFAQYDEPVPPGGTNPPSPYDPVDAVYAAARDLCANGAASPAQFAAAVFAYNHSQSYVQEVIAIASELGLGTPAPVHPGPADVIGGQ